MTIQLRYVDSPLGRIHLRTLPARAAEMPPLLCLHPAPYSGVYFTTAMPQLNARRDVLAPDYPGLGGSESMPAAPTIGDFARAMLACLDGLDIDGTVDVLGFHTGCLVAADMALAAPERCGRLILCDVPYFDQEQQAAFRERVAQPLPLTADLASLEKTWASDVSSRVDAAGLSRSIELFAEHLRAYPRDHEAFAAAFSYPCEDRFAMLDRPVTVIATESGLKAATEKAAADLSDATLVDAGDIKGAVFESGAARIAHYVLTALDDAA